MKKTTIEWLKDYLEKEDSNIWKGGDPMNRENSCSFSRLPRKRADVLIKAALIGLDVFEKERKSALIKKYLDFKEKGKGIYVEELKEASEVFKDILEEVKENASKGWDDDPNRPEMVYWGEK